MAGQKKGRQVLNFSLGNKEVLWISDTNQYVVTEKITANILKELLHCLKPEDIAPKIAHENDITEKEARDLIQHIQGMWSGNMARQKSDTSFLKQEYGPGTRVFSKKKYEINTVIFEVEYESPEAEWYNHPKFAHLETGTETEPDHFFRVGDSEGFLSIWGNGKHEGTWKREKNHFLSGRFSMKIIEKIYQKEELEWMGVFHAAGISNRRQSLLFFGGSGSGKSTLSALAMANGLDVLSDDFLPVDNRNGLVHRFPAALSIKKNAYDLVKIRYPEFMEGMEYNNPAFGKTYRYLAPRNLDMEAVPCKALIEVKYDPDIAFQLKRIPPQDAFAKLVPDSWINAYEENAKNFVNWFRGKKHYSLKYSDNVQMIEAVKKLLNENE